MQRETIKGSILLASEGINGTVAGTRESIDRLLSYLETDIVGGAFTYKESFTTSPPFKRTKVRLKKETISLGETAPLDRRGRYIAPKDWNAVIADPDTLVIDARNRYETELGMFAGATDPDTRTFKDLPGFVKTNLDPKKHGKIAAYCTGGIRCEKFTAWLLAQGFEDVCHLEGGILKYLEEVPEAESKWKGECFVFDERIAVRHGLVPSDKVS